MAMNCTEFLKIMDEDGPVTSGPAGEHLTACPGCQKAHEQWVAVRKELKRMKAEDSPPFLHTRVMAHVRSAGAVAAPRWTFFSWGRTAWAGPLLAAALLVLLGGYGLLTVMEPARKNAAQKQADTARQLNEIKKDLPPVSGPSKAALDGEYSEIIEKTSPEAIEDEKNANKEVADAMKGLPPLSGASKTEAQEELGGVVAASGKAEGEKGKASARDEDSASRDNDLRSQPAYAPEPVTPPEEAKKGDEAKLEAAAKAQEPPKTKASSADKPGVAQKTPPASPAPAAPAPSASTTIQASPMTPEEKQALAEEHRVPTVMTPELEAPVKCKLEPLGGGEILYITLQEVSAPPAGNKVGVIVNPDGKIQIQGSKGGRPKHPGMLYKAIVAAKLPVGKYALSRIVPPPK